MKVQIEMEVPNPTVAVALLRDISRRINHDGPRSFEVRYPNNGAVVGSVQFIEEVADATG